MKTLLKNANILFKDQSFDLYHGDILILDDTIIKIDHHIEKDEDVDLSLDCMNNILMPGLKNAHTHSAMVFARGLQDGLSQKEWLFDFIFPIEARLEKGDEYHLAKVSVLEYLRNGITSAMDMYLEPMATYKAFNDLDFRGVIVDTITSKMESVEAIRQRQNIRTELVHHVLGIHAEYTSNDEVLKEFAKLHQELKLPFYTHNSETEGEVLDCIKKRGMTPTEFFDSLGLLDYGGAMYHSVHLSDHDIELFKKHNIYVVTCPCSNAKLRCGSAPLAKYKEKGLKIAYGTDGPASNDGLDIFKEMGLSLYLNNDGTYLAKDALFNACCVGADAMDLPECDSLSVGKKADIVMLDVNQANLTPINNLASTIVYSANPINVKMTMVGGKILFMNDRYYLNEDSDSIYQKAKEITKRLLAK